MYILLFVSSRFPFSSWLLRVMLGKVFPRREKNKHIHPFLTSSYTKQTPVLSFMIGSHLSMAECDRWSHISSTPLAPGHLLVHVGKKVIIFISRLPLVTRTNLPSGFPQGIPGTCQVFPLVWEGQTTLQQTNTDLANTHLCLLVSDSDCLGEKSYPAA